MSWSGLRRAWLHLRQQVHDVLEVGGDAHPMAGFVDAFIITLIVANTIVFALETMQPFATRHQRLLGHFDELSVGAFTVEYLLRLWSCVDIPLFKHEPAWRARLKYALRPIMLIDLMAILPFYLQSFIPIDLRMLRMFRLFRMLKLVRYSPALQSLQRVFVQEWRALFGSLLVMLVLLLFCATIMYMVESQAQPDKFGSIPAALWWGLETLTTVGYGDVVPITPLGRIIGGIVMVLGLATFALPVAIIATGFSQEASRHEFVVGWGMIARVPLFATLNAAEVAEVARLVYARVFPPGAPIVSAGDPGGAMYIIESGEAVANLPGRRKVSFTSGDFFGEMALLEHRRHKHEVSAKTRCRVYVLDTVALAQLDRRHPEIMQTIRKVADERVQKSLTDLEAETAPPGDGQAPA